MQKVLVIVPFPMNEENRRQRMAQLQAVKLAPDIEFDFRPVRAGPTTYTNAHDLVLADLAIVDAGMHAEAEGYDAVCIDTMSDSAVSALRSIDVVPDSINLLKGKEKQVFPLLHQAALRCVEEDGADVILLGSTTMHEAHAWLAEHLPVPIINPGPLTYKLAEAALALRHSHSRKAYPAPLVPKPAMIDAILVAAQGQQREV